MPLTSQLVAQFCQTNDEFVAAVLNQPFVIDNHHPRHPLFKTLLRLLPRNIITDCLLDALTVFTDASSKLKRAGFVWQLHGYWYSHSLVVEGSAQILELLAVVEVLKRWPQQPLNIVIDSLYVVGIVQRLHFAFMGKIQNSLLFSAVTQLQHMLQQRQEPLFVAHIRRHTSIPGGLTEGNHRADQLVTATPVQLSTSFDAARAVHDFFHQSAVALQRQFSLPKADVHAIVAAYPDCARLTPVQDGGVNP